MKITTFPRLVQHSGRSSAALSMMLFYRINLCTFGVKMPIENACG